VVRGRSSGCFVCSIDRCRGPGCYNQGRNDSRHNGCCGSCRCCQHREVGDFVSEDHGG
jgi:hypothetical protein